MADGTNSYLHPGVYVQEQPGVPTIQSVSTSVPIFIGITEYLDASDRNVARAVSGWADYQARYGQSMAKYSQSLSGSQTSALVFGSQTSAAVYQFFAGGGTKCYVIGVNPDGASQGTLTISDPAVTLNVSAACIGAGPSGLISVATVDVGQSSDNKQPSNFFNVCVLAAQTDLTNPKTPTIWTSLLREYVKNNSCKSITFGSGTSSTTYYILESFGAFAASPLLSKDTASATIQLNKLMLKINATSMFIRVSCAVVTQLQQGMGDRNKVKPFKAGTPTTFDSKIYSDAYPALASPQDASLVATPDAAVVDIALDAKNGASYKEVIIDGVMQSCSNLRLPNLFYVIDAPFVGDTPGKQPGTIVDFVQGTSDQRPLSSEYAAIYYPWPVLANPIAGVNVPVPPSGAVLGCYAATDAAAGVHVSPAGVVNGRIPSASSLTKWLSESDQDQLNPNGINVIRSIPGYGITTYGARTLAGPGEWQYVAVRRFVTFFEQSVKSFLEAIVFQPNGEVLWATAGVVVSAFANLLWQQGALQGASPEEAFFVTCDATNNSVAQRSSGVLIIDVGLAVLYPAEFVVLRVSQMTSAPSSTS